MPRLAALVVWFLVAVGAAVPPDTGLPHGLKNTQNPKDVPPTPEEAVRRLKLPDGFRATLFAGEPDVAQPIAIDFDDRGRLWVAECFSYPNWKTEGQDRITIFEDADGDGRFDRRRVFWDKAPNLTSICIGNGGVWALCAPHLLFIPDRDGDDAPDGEPVIHLDGWTLKAGHNIVNGLMFGPDGWLYGRHGITHESLVGKPGTPEAKRTRINCGIWRYHPTRKSFEVVCHGTTNPWGMDFNEHGEAFFTNSVIGHLWHMMPGARFQRMYGQDYNPHSYELIESTSDHLHWGGGHWTTSRDGKGVHSEAGGGHAHSGGMIYLGDNWPDEYRHKMYMGNIHGNRINVNLLQREKEIYVGQRAPDFMTSDNPWFRPIALAYGPDGGVFVTDWCDLGECHDHDGVHRSSGRIYKITYGKPRKLEPFDLTKKTDAELVELQLHKNDWYVRHARRILAERAAAGKDMTEVHKALKQPVFVGGGVPGTLRAMWCLYVTGGANEEWLIKHLGHLSEHHRAWAIRLLIDGDAPLGNGAVEALENRARTEVRGLVRLHLASALQRVRSKEMALALAHTQHESSDAVFPLLLWYGLEPNVTANKSAAVELARGCSIPKVTQFIARRLTEAARDASELEGLIKGLGENPRSDGDFLQGMRQGLKGRKKIPMPQGWDIAYRKLRNSGQPHVQESAHVLGLTFQDPLAEKLLKQAVADSAAPLSRRVSALQALVEHQDPRLVPTLFQLVEVAELREPALRGLAAFNDPKTPAIILQHFARMNEQEKQAALGTLASRPAYALALLDAIDQKKIQRSDVSAFTARQLQDLRDPKVSERLAAIWGQIRATPSERKALIAKYKNMLTPDVLGKADAGGGRLVFNRLCSQCHVLYGAGTRIGPDLTGSNRADLHYVLENIIDPNAVIGRDYQLTNITTSAGRLVSGIVVEETERAVTIQTATERVVLAKADIDERRLSPVSMMPEGQFEQMTFTELRDLVAYLAGKEQAPLPK